MSVDPIFFLGAYVVNVSANIGWGGDSGGCTLTLVEDPDNGIIFKPPTVGTPCKFSYEGFSFGGIFTKHTYKVSVSEGRTYDVVLESPSKILDGVYIILDKWVGNIYTSDANVSNPGLNPLMTSSNGVNNVINIFGMKENIQYGGKFGGADINNVGFPIATLVDDIKKAMASGNFGSKIVYSEGTYDLDLSELSKVISKLDQYRTQSDFVTLNSLIREIVEIGLADHIFTLDGDVNNIGVITGNAVIKLKILDRSTPPDKGIVQQKIQEYLSLPDESKILSSYSIGKELTDVPTQKMLLGAPVSRYYVANRTDFLPIWGQTGTGANTQYFYGNNILDYDSMYTPIRITQDGGYDGGFTFVDTEILELRCALSDRKTWVLYHILKAIQLGQSAITIGTTYFTLNEYQKMLLGENVGPNDLIDTRAINATTLASWLYGYDTPKSNAIYLQKQIEARWNCMEQTAKSLYGSAFLVRIPFDPPGQENNFRWIKQNIDAEYSWDINVGSAWSGDFLDSINYSYFFDENSRAKMAAFYPNTPQADFSPLHSDYQLLPGGSTPAFGEECVGTAGSCEIDQNFGIRFMNSTDFIPITNPAIKVDSTGKKRKTVSNDVGFVKVTIPQVLWYDQWATQHNGFNSLCNLMLGGTYGAINVGYHNMLGFENIDVPLSPIPLIPYYIGIPQQSRRYVYGPWFAFGGENGKKGRLSVIEDAEFAPETFLSFDKMNEAAKTYVNSELADIYASESGYIELAEQPKFSIGDRLFAAGPYITSIAISINTGGMTTTYQLATWTRRNMALAKYNVDRIARSSRLNFREQKRIRDLFRPRPFANTIAPTLSMMEQVNRMNSLNYDMQGYSSPGAFGHFLNGAANAIENGNVHAGVNVQSAPFQNVARMIGLRNQEAAGQSFEQDVSPARIINVRIEI
jgi:hypothetical protein